MPLKDGFPMHEHAYKYDCCEIKDDAEPVMIRYYWKCRICGDVIINEEELKNACCCRM